jgi:hypothetical protein
MMKLVPGLDLIPLWYKVKNFVKFKVCLVEQCCLEVLAVIWVLL